MKIETRHFEAVIFSLKAAAAAVIAALAYEFLALPGTPWVAAVSAVLVTQPNLHSSLNASLMRVIANLAGAFGGAALSIAIGQPLAAMALGILLTGLVCYLLKQDEALRPAFVAVVIVTLTGENARWQSPLHRVTAVIIGCVCALALGFLFDKFLDWFKLNAKDEAKKPDDQE